jgi:hypothetical protein
LPLLSSVAVKLARGAAIPPVVDQAPLAGSYNSTVVTGLFWWTPPTTSTLPLVSRMAIWNARGLAREPVPDHVSVLGS